ncbi:polymorphic toxin type 15 domain-containing protein, partial [Pseudomonas avellanae]|uniref:polymorphic toxin type 15 domain-containing protein n=3 Tax=Pseudomonas avellanae TaxID=46257 RepID=UPI00217FBBAD
TVFEKISHQLTENSNLINSLACRLWVTYFENSTLAALHNPDLFAGGKDIIGDFGDRRINSSIGSQWPSRITGLDTAASNIPDINRETTKVNAKLKKC